MLHPTNNATKEDHPRMKLKFDPFQSLIKPNNNDFYCIDAFLHFPLHYGFYRVQFSEYCTVRSQSLP